MQNVNRPCPRVVASHDRPVFEQEALHSGALSSTPHAAYFLSNAAYADGAQADWGTGVGTLSVYVDDLRTPLFVTVVSLSTTMRLDSGRAWVGFTAATGADMWQARTNPLTPPPPSALLSRWLNCAVTALWPLTRALRNAPQVHDILQWDFVSSRNDVPYTPPPVINGMGAAQCSAEATEAGECAHL